METKKKSVERCQWCRGPARVEKKDGYTVITCTNPECKAVGRLS